VLPEVLRELFRAAFVDGARRPDDRPPARRWVSALADLRGSLVTCALDPAHSYGHHLPGCPWCPPVARSSRPATSVPGRRTFPDPPARRASPGAGSPGATPGSEDTVVAVGSEPLTIRTAPAPSNEHRPVPAPPRRRHALHAVAWVALAVVGLGGIIGVAGATGRSGSATTAPAGAASTRAASAPSSPVPASVRPAQDPTAALERIRAQDAATVEGLAGSWVAQLAARPAGGPAADRAAVDAAVLAGHESLRAEHLGAVLLRSAGWNYAGDLWATVMSERFATADEANAWCDAHQLAPRDCFAKKLSHSGSVEGSEKYRG
jgi:hypothetical protein